MRNLYFFTLILVAIGCVRKKTTPNNVIAKVYGYELTKEELKENLPKTTSVVDSLKVTEDYIKKWAQQKVLFRNALINLDNTEMLDKLVNKYKEELYTSYYKNALVNKKLDTIVTEVEIEDFYIKNQESFKLNEVLLKFRYIHLDRRNKKINVIKKMFDSDSVLDKQKILMDYSGYQDYYFNDSVWASLKEVYATKLDFPELTERDLSVKNKVITKISTDKSPYFIMIHDVLSRNEIAPLEYVKPTVKDILLHKNKIKFFDQMEQILIDDAVKQKKYEVY